MGGESTGPHRPLQAVSSEGAVFRPRGKGVSAGPCHQTSPVPLQRGSDAFLRIGSDSEKQGSDNWAIKSPAQQEALDLLLAPVQ